MSRSYRKPIATQGYKGRYRAKAKRQANKAVKDSAELPTRARAAYKRSYSSWDICDWKLPVSGTKARRK